MREEVRQHISTIFNNGWASPSKPFPVFFQNQKTKELATWGRFSIMTGKTEPAAVSTVFTRTPGIAVLQVFIPENRGMVDANNAADKLQTIFEFKQWPNIAATSTGEKLEITVESSITGPIYQFTRDGYAQYNISFAFRVDAAKV